MKYEGILFVFTMMSSTAIKRYISSNKLPQMSHACEYWSGVFLFPFAYPPNALNAYSRCGLGPSYQDEGGSTGTSGTRPSQRGHVNTSLSVRKYSTTGPRGMGARAGDKGKRWTGSGFSFFFPLLPLHLDPFGAGGGGVPRRTPRTRGANKEKRAREIELSLAKLLFTSYRVLWIGRSPSLKLYSLHRNLSGSI